MASETACVGFAPTNETGICINFRSQGENHYTLAEERQITCGTTITSVDAYAATRGAEWPL